MTLPSFKTITLERRERLIVLTLDRPEALNAVDRTLHDELPEALAFVAADPGSDLVMLTGAGRAFSAGGDIDHMERNANAPHLFDHEARQAKRIVQILLELEKPLVVRMNGHAVGLGATIALMGDIIVAADHARIGDPHVGIGLVAGDGGALIWAARIGLTRAKELLLTGELISAGEAERIGLINRCVPAQDLDAVVEGYCEKLLKGAPAALRWTKVLTNLELRRAGSALLDAGIAYEALSVRTADHREGLAALRERRAPKFTGT